MAIGLLLACNLRGSEIWLDVSNDSGLPWAALNNEVFPVGAGNNVHFTTPNSNYAGAEYTTTPAGMFFSAVGWTNLYTLLAREANPVVGAYLAVTLGNDGNVTYRYSLDASMTWDIGASNFGMSSATTWAGVANTLFPPPAPPPAPAPALVPDVGFQPIQTVIVPSIGLLFGGPDAFIDNPEPSTGLLLLTGVGLVWLCWRRRIKA